MIMSTLPFMAGYFAMKLTAIQPVVEFYMEVLCFGYCMPQILPIILKNEIEKPYHTDGDCGGKL